MTKHLRLENGKQEWLLYGGYNTTEVVELEGLDEGEAVRIQFYANGDASPMYCFDMIPIIHEGKAIILTDGKKPETRLRAEQTGDLTWTFKLFIDGVETLPELNYTTGLLTNLLDQVSDYTTGYAVCLEGSMAGKIIRIQHHGIGWFLRWEHNNERAEGFLEKKFAIIKDPDVLIMQRSRINQIQNVRSVNYELGVMLSRIVNLDPDDENVDQLVTLVSSIGHDNLSQEAMFDGFYSERLNNNPHFSQESAKELFEERLKLIEISFGEEEQGEKHE